jgi:hypothetical protein
LFQLKVFSAPLFHIWAKSNFGKSALTGHEMRLTTSAWAVVMMAVVCGEQAVAFSPAMPVTALTNGGARVPPSMSVRMMVVFLRFLPHVLKQL